jgi:penicillin-binding protein 1A
VATGLAERAEPKLRIRRGAVVRLTQTGKPGKGAPAAWTLTQVPEVEGALVALDPRSGEIRALVGGFDFNKNKFNHVTQAWRQPGSSFKPFIYSAALEKGFTPATVVNDAPLFFDAGSTGSQPWEPKNYDGKFEGPMSLRTALAKSKNMVSIRVLQRQRREGHPAMAHPFRLRGRQAPGLSDDGAGRRLGDADADGRGLQRCSPTAGTACRAS